MFKKFFALFFALVLISSNVHAADQWDKTAPQGTDDPSDLDTILQENNAALDRILFDYRKDCTVVFDSTTQVKIRPGEISIPNAGGTVVRWRKNTTELTLTAASNMDSGTSFTISTQYYVYVTGDDDETGFDGIISANSSAPSGKTYYRRAGYFYVNAAGEITSVGNIAGGDVENIVTATGTSQTTTTSGSPADMTDMVAYVVTSGRPLKLTFNGPIEGTDGGRTYWLFDVDGTDYATSSFYPSGGNGGVTWENFGNSVILNGLAAGAHTVKVQWYVSAGTAYQDGTTATSTRPSGTRTLSVEEL